MQFPHSCMECTRLYSYNTKAKQTKSPHSLVAYLLPFFLSNLPVKCQPFIKEPNRVLMVE